MKIKVFVIISVFLKCCECQAPFYIYDNEEYPQPEQIHLSVGADETQMMVTWVTLSPTNSSVVEFGLKENSGVSFNRRVYGKMTLYQDFGSERRKIYNHRVLLTNLVPGKTYVYHCGDPKLGFSAIYWFRATPNHETFDPRFLIYGDLGNRNGQAIALLQNEVQTSTVDAIIHVGDMAYDMDDDNARRGDEFMRQIEPIAAYLPYQVSPGNHEWRYNFSNYDARFSMFNVQQKSLNNFYYSYNMGPVHIVSISTEFYFFLNFGFEQIKYQYEWLIDDLTEANRKENREKRPWIFLIGHRPMYCTNTGHSDCSALNSITRTGMVFTNEYALEPLMKKFGIDMFWVGHQHSYERLWPIFNGTILNGTDSPYTEPRAPIHIVTGSPGCEEGLSEFGDDPLKVSAFRASSYSFTRCHVVNKNQIDIQQVSAPDGKVIDAYSVKKSTAFPKWMDSDFSLGGSSLRI